MRKDQYLFRETREKAVREAQTLVDQYVPGKVKVYCEWCEDTNAWYMIGEYQSYMVHGRGIGYKREKMDRYYDADLFAYFFKQRAAFMNASYYWQIQANDNNIHPAMFKEWFDSFKRTSSDMISYLDKDPELVK